MGSGEVGIFLFMICVLAILVIIAMGILADTYPVLALAVGSFCVSLLAVLVLLMAMRRGDGDAD